MFGLSQQHIDLLCQCFKRNLGIELVIIYGSRAKGNYKRGSDIDLTIQGALDFGDLLKLENEIDDLLLPYKIDLSLMHQISNPDLLAHIESVGKVFYPPPHQTSLIDPPKHNTQHQNTDAV
ncbi:MAG TPA: nucleotidyltransferase domain-containing protein [Chitinophagales bacterium]|nr:nucleotidyltransferase domain-containing protein [Chitinophagales bacterium]HRK27087.1 nucleotidyltransferase domain-containing protein [Chitinophagales bacterium]